MEYLSRFSGCALGYRYEVSLEALVQTTKGPLFHHVVLSRVHSFNHLFPTRGICRESTLSAPLIGMPNKHLPHTTPGHTLIGSWLHYFHGQPLHKQLLRFGYVDYHRLSESTGQSLNCQNQPNIVPNPSPQIPILHTNREQRY
jgi:hypothetical protein